jgi:Trp operon repressor
MLLIVELLSGTYGQREIKENDRASVISYNITSVKVKDTRTCIESF